MSYTRDDYEQLLLDGTPLLDVRAPVEFARGALPGAVNLPLLNDAEREAVGIRYKNAGNDAAVALGHELVTGAVKQERVGAWLAYARQHPAASLYCFRGGQRSQIAQAWLAEAGCQLPRVAGGYKAARRFVLERLESFCRDVPITVLGGYAGSGKTDVIADLPDTVDLEGLANHRGSAFGRRVGGQPTTINFEHELTLAWLKLEASDAGRVMMEDESRLVGRLSLPPTLWESLTQSPVAVLNVPFAERVERIIRDYVVTNLADWEASGAEDAREQFEQGLRDSLDRVQKRLGGARHRQLRDALDGALKTQRASGGVTQHGAWVEPLLQEYYDPMYQYQMERKAERVVYEGTPADLQDWWISR
ncbi:MAG: tRNA 2-selenouridine(34) synthase MnmH [Pseudomonadota bacterium]